MGPKSDVKVAQTIHYNKFLDLTTPFKCHNFRKLLYQHQRESERALYCWANICGQPNSSVSRTPTTACTAPTLPNCRCAHNPKLHRRSSPHIQSPLHHPGNILPSLSFLINSSSSERFISTHFRETRNVSNVLPCKVQMYKTPMRMGTAKTSYVRLRLLMLFLLFST